jgi:hypothetical protein
MAMVSDRLSPGRTLWRLVPAFACFVLACACIGPLTQGAPAARQSANTNQGSSPSADQDAAKTQPANIAVPLPKGKKLILKDGSFQVVREYHREGDSVRYYSVERSAWEEIPADLVDWAATQKGEAEQDAADKKLVAKLKAADLAARTANIDADSSYEVREGLLLPDAVGLYALSGTQIVTLQQTLAASHLNKARTVERVASGVALIPQKHDLEIPGKHANLRVSPNDLEFYFRTADGKPPDMELLRTVIQGDRRKLEAMSTNVVGINNYKGSDIRIQIWDAAEGLYRFTVEQALTPGEYALVQNDAEGNVSLYIWDFGVDTAPRENGSPSDQKPREKP